MGAFTDKAKQLASKALDIAEMQEQLDALHDEFQSLLKEYNDMMPAMIETTTSEQIASVSDGKNVPTMKGQEE